MDTLHFLCVIVLLHGVFAGPNTICDKKQAIQSSTGKWRYPGYAERAVDSITSTDVMLQGCTHTDKHDPNPWLLVDLGCTKKVNKVIIINRSNTPERLQKFVVTVHEKLPNPDVITDVCVDHPGALEGGRHVLECHTPLEGRFLLIRFKNPSDIHFEQRFIHVCDVGFE